MSRRRTSKTPKWLLAARAADQGQREGQPKPDWLVRALARAGVLSPSEAEAAVRAGRVRVGERVVHAPLWPLRFGERVFVDGREVSLSAPTLALAFHKPAGVVTSSVDPEGQGTVFERLHAVLEEPLRAFGWHAIGRLDRNTTGLLLFTNDERLVAHVTSPATHLPKRYLARVSGHPTEEKLERLRRGLLLHDGPTRPAKARLVEPQTVELELTEGRHHQVKRMLGEVGLPVLALHREAIGAVACDAELGRYRALTETEIREGLGFLPGP